MLCFLCFAYHLSSFRRPPHKPPSLAAASSPLRHLQPQRRCFAHRSVISDHNAATSPTVAPPPKLKLVVLSECSHAEDVLFQV
ncbi:hypothetical protein L195_g061389 [Trifolium pratense]|uniref:Uncharacterized protein n=1 Tax=Trifolium pratense TaxID=57577 RepID=A0A2K3K9L5_TRIPR|nr:hypothetical protein L195_g061389 [Trifolium pratense]